MTNQEQIFSDREHFWSLRTFIIIAGVLTAVALSGCSSEKASPQEVIRPVRYKAVYAQGVEKVRTFSGVTKSTHESKLSFKIPGTIEQIYVKVGESVKNGQILASLDKKDVSLKVQEAELGLKQAEAQLRTATNTYNRVKALYENDNASLSQLDQAQAAYESLKAKTNSIRKQVEFAKLQLSYCELRAPANGSIATLVMQENENTAAGYPVMVLNENGKPEIEVRIPESLIDEVKVGQSVKVQLSSLNKEYEGTVYEVGVSSLGMITTYPVTIRLNEDAATIKSGMSADVEFHFEANQQLNQAVYYVDSHSVLKDRKETFVYIVVPADSGLGTVHKTAVEIGELQQNGLQVLKGLNDGDMVITAGMTKLKDGQKVKL